MGNGPSSSITSNCPPSAIISNSAVALKELEVKAESVATPLITGVAEAPLPLEIKFPSPVKMKPEYINETDPKRAALLYERYRPNGVTYLSPLEREKYRVRFGSDGRLYASDGTLFDTRKAKFIDTEDKVEKVGSGIFVLAPDGNLYLSNFFQQGVFHHSSFLAGGEVICAGEMVVEDGVIIRINNLSGHYRAPNESLSELGKYLKKIWQEKTPKAILGLI